MKGYFCGETVQRPSTVGSFRMPHKKNIEAAAAATCISLGQCVATTAADGCACRHSSDNSCGVSNDKTRVPS